MKIAVYFRIAAIALASAGCSAQAQDSAAGRGLFQQRCQMCHAVTPDGKNGIGPNLRGVVNRPVAGTTFAYSAALKSYKHSWTKDELDRYLVAPGKVVPGTGMVVNVSDPAQRANIIAYLGSLGR
jgi:cytochrome c